MRTAYADATRLVWQIMIGFAGAGLLTTVLMGNEPMRKTLDDRWGLQEMHKQMEREQGDVEVERRGVNNSSMSEGVEVDQKKTNQWSAETHAVPLE